MFNLIIKPCLFILIIILVYSEPMAACEDVKKCKKKKHKYYRSYKRLNKGKKTISKLQALLGTSDNPDRVIKLVHNITIIQNEIELRKLKCRRLKQEISEGCSSCINISELPSSE